MRVLVAIALFAFAARADAQGSQSSANCAAFQHAIDASEAQLSMIFARGLGDDSAPRATLRAEQQGNELRTIAINLELMIQLRCPLPKQPITTVGSYLSAALACATAQTQGEKDPAACKREKWLRDSPPK
jgi:hypothetical protein